jgi:hypothetical protein
MPYLGALLAATLCGWLVDAVLAPFAPVPLRVLIGFLISTTAFYWSLHFLRALRGR